MPDRLTVLAECLPASRALGLIHEKFIIYEGDGLTTNLD